MSYTVPKITAGQATPAKFNAPLEAIETILNNIDNRLTALSNKSAILQYLAGVSSDALEGDLLYFDSSENNSIFRPAKAVLLGEPGEQGQSVEAPSSRVLGLLLSKDPVTILRNGYYKSSVILNTIGGDKAKAGIYFLDASDSGKATLDPGWNLRQPCLSYYGDNKFSLVTNYLAHDNHHHGSYKVPVWYPASMWDTSKGTKKGLFYYLIPSSANIGQISSTATAVFYDGLLNTDDFVLDGDVIWYTELVKPENNSVVLFNSYPFAYGDAVVRDVQSATLNCVNNNGYVSIESPEFLTGSTDYASLAISSIASRTINYSPIISRLIGGSGTTVTLLGSGAVAVSMSSHVGNPVDATDLQLNGTQRAVSDLLTYTVFPSGKTTLMTMSYPVTGNSALIHYNISVWFTVKGPGTGRLYIKLFWIPLDKLNAVTIPSSLTGKTLLINVGNTDNSKLVYYSGDIDSDYSISGDGTLAAVVQVMQPTADVYIHRCGFALTPVSADTSDSISDADFERKLQHYLKFNANY